MASNRVGTISDRGVQGMVYRNKRIKFESGSWLEPFGSIVMFEDFVADHIAEDSAVLIGQSGTALTAANIAVTAGPAPVGHGGWLQGKTDDVDGEIDEVAFPVPFLNASRATNDPIVADFGFVIPTALTARMYFAGFGDASTGGADDDGMISITTGTTLVSGATGDATGFVYSSLATDADGFYMGAVKSTGVGTAELSAAGSLDTVAVDNYLRLRVEADSDGDVYFYGAEDLGTLNRNVRLEFIGSQAAAITANVLYTPIFSAATTTTTGVEWELDYIFGAGPA